MNKKLLSAIGVAILGTIIAFVACNLLFSEIEPVSFKNVDASFTTDIPDPNPEIFNPRALNPTVEVYVGNCETFDEFGQCVVEENR
ncbi:hypothetical protein IKF34_01970 [Candidatus Saccharibacteria bacterium]|nr:hypothetical protein [Candidatus Saccharibacteria bacterium]